MVPEGGSSFPVPIHSTLRGQQGVRGALGKAWARGGKEGHGCPAAVLTLPLTHTASPCRHAHTFTCTALEESVEAGRSRCLS